MMLVETGTGGTHDRGLRSSAITTCRLLGDSSAGSSGISGVWGLAILFQDGREMTLPDISTNRQNVEAFRRRLEGQTASPETIWEITEDFIQELAMLPLE